jgi:hypothetical protein
LAVLFHDHKPSGHAGGDPCGDFCDNKMSDIYIQFFNLETFEVIEFF